MSLGLPGPSFPCPPPGKSKAWFREPKLGSWQDGAVVGLRDGVSEAGSPHPLWRGRNQPAGGLSTHAGSGEDGGGNEVKALSYLPGP